jgi:hypothetical protein
MAGLVPATHDHRPKLCSWVAATRAAMTIELAVFSIDDRFRA